jgi:excinuclease ABC subunit B
VVLYADVVTDSIRNALAETDRRRQMQLEFNRVHGIVPQTIVKPIREAEADLKDAKHVPKHDIPALLVDLDAEMRSAAEQLDFERAIAIRERIRQLEQKTEARGAPTPRRARARKTI